MFIRIFRQKEGKELLLNVDHITKIEVEYTMPGPGENYFKTGLEQGMKNPAAVRWYTVHVGGEQIKLIADPDNPITQVIEEIYKNAIKGDTKKPQTEV